MAGIKHAYQSYGVAPFGKLPGKTIWDRHAALQQRQLTPYCKLCGNEIVNSPVDENGHKVNPEWEATYQVHYRCYLKHTHQ